MHRHDSPEHDDRRTGSSSTDHSHSHGHDHQHGRGDARGHAHDDAHGQGHGHVHAAGIKGFVPSILRPHSHDPSDSIDSALRASAEGIRALKISLVALGATAAAQMVLVLVTGSVALLADTVHNFSDALTAVPLWIAFVLARRVPTRRYTYGYGRAEDLAGVFIVAMIALSAAVAGYESIRRLLEPRDITNPGVVLAAGLIGFIGNEAVALYRIRVGRKIGSAALVADGLHARTDGFTSLAVAGGAIGVMLGFPLADPIVGLLITVAILAVLRGAARDIYRRLMDAVEPELVDRAEAALRAVPGVVDVAGLRLRWLGHRLRAETDITIDGALGVVDGHAIAVAVEHALLHAIPRLDAATVHVNPLPADGSDPHEALARHLDPSTTTAH